MRYKIKSSLIQNSWFEQAIFKTLAMYDNGEDLTHSPLNEFQRNWQSWGGKHQKCVGVKDLEKCIQERQKDFIALYESIKNDGYFQFSPPFLVYFDDDGYLNLYDGHHRMSILRYLGKEIEIEVETEWQGIDTDKTKGRDFPLVEKLMSRFNGQKYMYHYVPDIRVKDFKVQRPDGEERLNWIFKKLKE